MENSSVTDIFLLENSATPPRACRAPALRSIASPSFPFATSEFKNKHAEVLQSSSYEAVHLWLEYKLKVLRKCPTLSPLKIVLAKPSPHCSATCPNTWKAEPRKKNTLSLFQRNFTPPNQKCKECFRGCRGSMEAVAERFILAQKVRANAIMTPTKVVHKRRGPLQKTLNLEYLLCIGSVAKCHFDCNFRILAACPKKFIRLT